MVLYEYMKAKRALLVISVLMGCIVLAQSARGITYQSETTVEFTLNSSNTLTISGDAILALAPGTFGTSSSITVVMTTTNLTGAKLMADVGKNESPYVTNNLVGTNGHFTSLDYQSSGSTPVSALLDNYWGYYTTTASALYGLPPINIFSPKQLKIINTSGSNSTNFSIGAKASSTQPSGTYLNYVNFTMVANPAT